MIILASKSPRRKELLSLITDDFTVDSAEVDETLPCDIEPDKAVEYLSKINLKKEKNCVILYVEGQTAVLPAVIYMVTVKMINLQLLPKNYTIGSLYVY